MADKKITELTAYTPPIDTDVMPIVDITTTQTKKITWANIKATLKTYFDTLYTTTAAVATQITTALSGIYAPLASPTFTGAPTLPTGTVATTQAALDSSTKVATTAFVLGEKRGYTLQFGATQFSPADATTYYFGSYQGSVTGDTGANHSRIYIPKAGKIKAIFIHIDNSGTVGTSETSTISVRLNDTTDITISAAVTTNAANSAFNNQALTQDVVAGDFIIIKWVTPTWSTNPTNCRVMGVVYVE